MFLQELKYVVLPNYPLVLSLLKPRKIRVFWNPKKKSDPNRRSPLNSSIENSNLKPIAAISKPPE